MRVVIYPEKYVMYDVALGNRSEKAAHVVLRLRKEVHFTMKV